MATESAWPRAGWSGTGRSWLVFRSGPPAQRRVVRGPRPVAGRGANRRAARSNGVLIDGVLVERRAAKRRKPRLRLPGRGLPARPPNVVAPSACASARRSSHPHAQTIARAPHRKRSLPRNRPRRPHPEASTRNGEPTQPRQSAALRHVPGTLQRSGRVSGVQRKDSARSALPPCLKAVMSRCAALVALDPGQGSAALHLSGNVRQGGTLAVSAALHPPPHSRHPGRSAAESRDLHRIRIGFNPLILRSRPAWVCVSKDEGSLAAMVQPAGIPRPSRRHAKPHVSLGMRGGAFFVLTIFLHLPSCVHSSPKRGRFRSGLWRGGEAAPAPVEYLSAVPGGLLKAACAKG